MDDDDHVRVEDTVESEISNRGAQLWVQRSAIKYDTEVQEKK